MEPFNNKLEISDNVIKSLDYMLKYQNYLLMKMIKNETGK